MFGCAKVGSGTVIAVRCKGVTAFNEVEITRFYVFGCLIPPSLSELLYFVVGFLAMVLQDG
jgi:hypothetical protein